jgi:hypothetical protein
MQYDHWRYPLSCQGFTASFETYAVVVLKSTDVTKASAILGISWDLAWNIMNKAVERGFAMKTSNPEITGVDDKSFGKPLDYDTTA